MCSGKTRLADIHQVWKEDGYSFWSCLSCGSETSDRGYTAADYDCDNRDDYFLNCLGGWDKVLEELNTNVSYFEHHMDLKDKRFLDVGYCDGAMMTRMVQKGCSVWGFDVFNHKATKIAERGGFSEKRLLHSDNLSNVYHSSFDLIQCREVIEHVPNPHTLMKQMAGLLEVGGLLQVQTPLPSGLDSQIPYQIQHLCLISHIMLRTAGIAQGLKIIETLRWPSGQLILFQK